MFCKDIGIDLGTANVLVHVKGRGIVANEPSVVTIESGTRRVLAVGEEARRMLGRTPGNIVAIRPLRDGVIADFEVTEIMLRYFIDKSVGRGGLLRPRVMICIPANITSVERKAVREAAERCGAKQVFLIEEPKAAALGANLDIFQPNGSMIVDIGGGTTDVAVLSLGDVAHATSIRTAGDKFDEAIVRYVKKLHNLLIGERTAEDIKIQVATVMEGHRREEIDVRGRDIVTGLPKTVTIHSAEICVALEESAYAVVAATKSVLERTDPELAADIFDRGIMLTGGGALLNGLQQLMHRELQVPIHIAEDPMSCVVKGTGIALENLDKVGGGAQRPRRRARVG